MMKLMNDLTVMVQRLLRYSCLHMYPLRMPSGYLTDTEGRWEPLPVIAHKVVSDKLPTLNVLVIRAPDLTSVQIGNLTST